MRVCRAEAPVMIVHKWWLVRGVCHCWVEGVYTTVRVELVHRRLEAEFVV